MSGPSRPLRALLACALALTLGAARAQEPPEAVAPASGPGPSRRPKVGLALSGGGARGAAHVGVLKVIEDLHIRVDCIAGTSMGAVVGGLYASGMSPAQIEAVLDGTDWASALSDSPPREDLTFRKKEEGWLYQNRINMGARDGKILLPGGFVEGQNLFFLLETLTLPVEGTGDFDRLPIPFRAVGTDIVTGERVVLSRGNLAEAIRASMAIPGIFSPVEIDGRLLVDGGLSDNIPVDVCREMGADIVIAVDISTPLSDRDHLGNVIQVIRQLTNFLTRRNMEGQLKDADLLLVPDLRDFGSGDFEKASAIIARGEAEARDKAPALRGWSVAEAEYAPWLKRLRARDERLPALDFVRVEGDVRPGVAQSMETAPGKVLEIPTLRRDIDRLYGTARFKRVEFRLVQEGELEGLCVVARQKPWGPNYLRFGFAIHSDFGAGSAFTLLAGFTKTRINSMEAEWRTDLQLGPKRLLVTEFYQPLDGRQRWFVAPRGGWGERTENLYDGKHLVAQYRLDDIEVGADLGLNLSPCAEVRLGPVWSQRWGNRKVGTTILPGSFEVTDAGLSGRLKVDTLDSASFPKEGSFFSLDAYLSRETLGSYADYDKLDLYASRYARRGRSILFGNLQGGTNLGTRIPPYATFSKGGIFSMGAYEEGQLRGQRFAIGQVGCYYRLASFPPSLGEGLFLGSWVSAGNVWAYRQPVTWEHMKYSLTLSLAADTLVGPVYIAVSQGTGGNRTAYLYIGRSF